MAKYFIGLTFSVNNLQAKRLLLFRQHYCQKSEWARPLFLSLLPPFELSSSKHLHDLTALLTDDIESQLLGAQDRAMSFAGPHFREGKNCMAYLKANFPLEFYYIQEALLETLLYSNVSFSKKKLEAAKLDINSESLQAILPLARTGKNQFALQEAYINAREQFQRPMSLLMDEICLFKKRPIGLSKERTLFTFPKSEDILLAQDPQLVALKS